ncbi:uncharacterized protein J2S13_001188 [Oikeobacillus pervagus]|uniref:DUF418 domain-containing protein n=1 Tax=Oikeobacillus pervagus TaxID=1325931 RepID=A0AAJ1T3Z2_9BACI|nr:DUF418 domain-containing protein [Oikeobacillus pervagus]MDQ0214791.1 uncharacterized protein [Oikeobacillus pervagus]
MSNNFTPIEKTNRIQSLDVMRGFALLGIFLVNMISFHSPFLYYDPYEWWSAPNDHFHYQWIDIFVQASFYPLFAMLFGYGTALQKQRADARGVNYWPIGLRRFFFLLCIGSIHAFLIWSGDILINYAVLGFLLLLMLRFSGKTLLIIGSILFVIPNVFISIMLLLLSKVDPTSVIIWTDLTGMKSSISSYTTDSFQVIMKQRLADWTAVNNIQNMFLLFIAIFPMMLIGAGAAKLDLLTKWTQLKKKLFAMFLFFFLVAVLLKYTPYLFEKNLAYIFVQDSLGGPLLATAYAVGIVLMVESSIGMKITKPLASAGRMSLTNYLMQSIVGTFLFYGYGIGLYGKISLTTGTMLVFAIFIMQVILSELWLLKFKQGPIEKVWRMLTYGKSK